jgi:hypothetical protein
MSITFDEKTFRRIFYACYIALAVAVACAILSATTVVPSESSIYVKESFTGTGSGSTLHEGRLAESSGFRNATVSYSYDKTVTDSGSQDQNVEFMMAGGDGSYWNFQRVWTDKQIAGHNSLDIRVGQISGSYYGKSGMKISYDVANASEEEFESSITIDTRDGNASLQFDVIQWQGAGEPIPQYDDKSGNFTGYEGGESLGKPVSISEIDLVGQFLVEQLVQLKAPPEDKDDWLEFCNTLDKDLPAGYKVLPVRT